MGLSLVNELGIDKNSVGKEGNWTDGVNIEKLGLRLVIRPTKLFHKQIGPLFCWT